MNRPTLHLPKRGTTLVVVQELEFACDLLRRAQEAIDKEFRVLRGAGIVIDFGAERVTGDLLNLAFDCYILAARARASMDTSQKVAA